MSRLQWIILPGAAILLGVTMAYLGYLWTRPEGAVIRGSVYVYSAADPTRPYTSGGCAEGDIGTGEFADLHRGTVVKVTDETGKVLSVAGLSRGADTLDLCTFAFAAGPVDESLTYTVQIGERAPTTFTHDEIVARRWQVSFDLTSQASQ